MDKSRLNLYIINCLNSKVKKLHVKINCNIYTFFLLNNTHVKKTFFFNIVALILEKQYRLGVGNVRPAGQIRLAKGKCGL